MINKNYFEELNETHKLYYLGYLYADGYVCKYTTQLQLHIKDIDILTKFNNLLSSKNLIKLKDKNMARLTICSKIFSEFLIKIGCTQNKTFTLTFPTIDEKYISHFMRGYFDGDGCVSFYSNRCEFSILGTKSFCESYKDILLKNVDITYNIKIATHGVKKSIYRLRIQNSNDILNVLKFLYKDCGEYCLSRKYEKLSELEQFIIKMNENKRKFGKNNPSTKKWIAITPQNEIINITDGLNDFCEKYMLPVASIRNTYMNKGVISNSRNIYLNGWEFKSG